MNLAWLEYFSTDCSFERLALYNRRDRLVALIEFDLLFYGLYHRQRIEFFQREFKSKLESMAVIFSSWLIIPLQNEKNFLLNKLLNKGQL